MRRGVCRGFCAGVVSVVEGTRPESKGMAEEQGRSRFLQLDWRVEENGP